MTNKIKFDLFLSKNYTDIIKRINNRIHNKQLSNELLSHVVNDYYVDIMNDDSDELTCNLNVHYLLRDDNSTLNHIIKRCLNVEGWRKDKFWTKEKNINRFVPLEDISEYDLFDEYDIDYKIDIKNSKLSNYEDVLMYNKVTKYFNSLQFDDQVLFELLYIEKLNGKELHKRLNNNIKLSKRSCYQMINEFKLNTKKTLLEWKY